LDDLQPISILLDEDFKITLDIDTLYRDVENDLVSYNKWIQGLDIGDFSFQFDEPPMSTSNSNLLEKRSYDSLNAYSAPHQNGLIENSQNIIEEFVSNEPEINEEAIADVKKSKKKVEETIDNSKVLSSLSFDWDFDKQFQIMKKIHLEDEFFTI